MARSLGYLDDLEREWGPGALARCEAIRDEMTAVDRETGELLDCGRAVALDGAKLAEERRLDDLAAVSCTNAGGNWWLFDHRTGLTDGLFALIGRESPAKWMRTSDIKALLNKSIEPVVEIPREDS